MTIMTEIPSVNYHLWKPCNMRCGFCFATFQEIKADILPEGHLGREDCLLIVESLARAGFRKINFAGGEPTLCRWLPELINRAKELGLTTSVVTNGSRLTREWLGSINGSLDWVTLSIHSLRWTRSVGQDRGGIKREPAAPANDTNVCSIGDFLARSCPSLMSLMAEST